MKFPLWATALSATLIVQIMSAFASATIPLLGPILTERWGLAPEKIGYVSAATSVGICWFLACGGPLLERHGPLRTLQLGLVLIALGLACLVQPVVWVGLVGALLVGLGAAPNTPAGSQILQRTAPAGHRTLIFSIKQAGVPLGGAFAGLLVAPLLGVFGFIGAILAVISAVIFCAVLVQVFRRPLDTERIALNDRWARSFVSLSLLTRSAHVLAAHPTLPLLTAMGAAFSITQACVTAFTATYMVTQQGSSLAQAGLYVAVLLAASTVARIFLGWLADRLGSGLLLLSVLAIAAGGAILLLLRFADADTWLIYGSMALIGATCLGWNGVHMAELARISPNELIGEVTSGANLFGFVGSLCGPLMFTIVASRTGSFSWSFLLIAGQLAAFGLFAIWRLTFHGRSR
ncbi:MAG: MFS transporter [Hyphomicrobiaceae bacterium]